MPLPLCSAMNQVSFFFYKMEDCQLWSSLHEKRPLKYQKNKAFIEQLYYVPSLCEHSYFGDSGVWWCVEACGGGVVVCGGV